MSDPMTDALDALRISTTLYAVARLEGSWGVGFPAGSGPYFHVVRGDDCVLTLDGRPDDAPLTLADGDVVLLPHGSPHRLTGSPGARVNTVFDEATWTPRRLVAAGPPHEAADGGTELVCGAVHVAHPASHPVLRALPPVLVVRPDTPGAGELGLVVRVLAAEFAEGRPGVDSVLARLGDVLLVQVLRIWAARHTPAATGWLAAVADPDVGPALTALHADPAAPWTVEQLAAVAGLSRSRFAERFTALVGQPPLAYLGAWRMTRAAALLAEPRSTVRDVGRRVGFTSEPAFSRAFARHHGMPPSRYRAARAGAGRPDRAAG